MIIFVMDIVLWNIKINCISLKFKVCWIYFGNFFFSKFKYKSNIKDDILTFN